MTPYFVVIPSRTQIWKYKNIKLGTNVKVLNYSNRNNVLDGYSHCQWVPVRTVSYCTPSRRVRIRRFPLAEAQLFPAMWLKIQFQYVKWRMLKVIFVLYQISYFHRQRKKFEKSKTALTFYHIFWSETIHIEEDRLD